jgi:TIR domain
VPRPTLEPVKVFISYSHKDERYREQLKEHLYAAKRQGLIEDWHDRKIAPGEEWQDLINENLETSEIILLLVSSSFIASPYSYNTKRCSGLWRSTKRARRGSSPSYYAPWTGVKRLSPACKPSRGTAEPSAGGPIGTRPGWTWPRGSVQR